jgi:hypothetical protein
MSFDLQQLTDRAEIADLTNRYAIAVDSQNWDLYRSLFTRDAAVDYTDAGGIAGPRDAVVPWLSAALGFCAATQHNMTTQVIVLDDGVEGAGDSAATARACTYYIAQHVTLDGKGGESHLLFAGFYSDRFRRTAQGWRISERIEKGTWLDGLYPDDVPRPTWFATTNHPVPTI